PERPDAVHPHPGHPAPDALTDPLAASLRSVTEQEALARVYIAIAVSGGRNRTELKNRVLRHHEKRVERFAAAVSRLKPEMEADEARQRAETLVTSLNGMTLHYVLDTDFDLAVHARSLAAETVGA